MDLPLAYPVVAKKTRAYRLVNTLLGFLAKHYLLLFIVALLSYHDFPSGLCYLLPLLIFFWLGLGGGISLIAICQELRRVVVLQL